VQRITQLAIEKAQRSIFTREDAAFWAGSEGAALNSLLKRAVKAGEVVRYRQGVYGLAPRFKRETVHPFELAQYLHGPSYLSLECALSHHGWIPEAVFTVTCVTQARSRSFQTPLGLFSFTRIPQELFFAGVQREMTPGGGAYLMATPLKALADYVYVHRPEWNTLASACESLRIEEGELDGLDGGMFEELEGVYRERLVLEFLDNVRKEVMR
jgi:hypothetical protein